ncbi:hypothetical protein CEP52_017674, partial [Fusarium oligoseptatum]
WAKSPHSQAISDLEKVTCGFQCLKEQSVMFGIDSIRVDLNGVVKIVIDWNLESCVEGMFLEANEGYLVAYLEEILTTMEHSCGRLPSAAMDFLTPTVLPAMNFWTYN